MREVDPTWHFEPDISKGNAQIRLYSGMSFAHLRAKVKDKLRLRAHNISVKLSYQYQEWLVIDDNDGSTPHYITEDHEVAIFIEMRRKIEEVNMFVTVSVNQTGMESSRQEDAKLTPVRLETDVEDAQTSDEDDYESDDECHDFAMSETPLTAPGGMQALVVAGVQQ